MQGRRLSAAICWARRCGDDARRGCLAPVELPRRERGELEEGRARVGEPVDALADEELALLGVALLRSLAAALVDLREASAQLVGEGRVVGGVFLKVGIGGADTRFQGFHGRGIVRAVSRTWQRRRVLHGSHSLPPRDRRAALPR